ncbi:MAG: hypothetical protein E4H01_11355 [Lysobacterales bacterium]|nr:MAG: hypothetical protein E4H01_11355 [Xanthomonadales bacterium]
MKNFITGFFIGGILGLVGGFAAGIFVFPHLFPPPPVNEVVDTRTSSEIVASGSFIHANPSDPVHYGKGRVIVYAKLLHLEADFEVGPGPKFHVYLVPESDITPATRVQDSMFVDLGRLKAFSGGQNYPIPDGVDLRTYKSVVIWCEQFNVLISPAVLKIAG